MNLNIRKATIADIPTLRELIDASVRVLQAHDYTPAQLEKALQTVYGVDSQLIEDGTYFVAESTDADQAQETIEQPRMIVGCGGWSKRRTLYGGDSWTKREDDLLDARNDAAKIRAFFVHPDWVRHGIGSALLKECEAAAEAAGFSSFEMGATLSGVPLYEARGYIRLEELDVPLGSGESLKIIHMKKDVRGL